MALLAFFLLRFTTETPIKPSSAGISTWMFALTVSLLAAAWSERTQETATEPPAKDVVPDRRPFVHAPQYWS
jgi:hypothetical protein